MIGLVIMVFAVYINAGGQPSWLEFEPSSWQNDSVTQSWVFRFYEDLDPFITLDLLFLYFLANLVSPQYIDNT